MSSAKSFLVKADNFPSIILLYLKAGFESSLTVLNDVQLFLIFLKNLMAFSIVVFFLKGVVGLKWIIYFGIGSFFL